MVHCNQRVRFAATWREEFFEVPYYDLISRIKPQIETLTGTNWETPAYSDLETLFREYELFSRRLSFGDLPAYKYMVYLRHHGFPSPLMDWTRSPYVAAYFAFRRITGKHVCIYVFCESPRNMKFRSSDRPTIHRFGPYVQSHKRHFLQQSEYTICASFQGEWFFVPHEGVFDRGDKHEVVQQDVLWKFNLPAMEQVKVLRLLDEYNLNGYSLFGSEESLMETMAFRELRFRE